MANEAKKVANEAKKVTNEAKKAPIKAKNLEAGCWSPWSLPHFRPPHPDSPFPLQEGNQWPAFPWTNACTRGRVISGFKGLRERTTVTIRFKASLLRCPMMRSTTKPHMKVAYE